MRPDGRLSGNTLRPLACELSSLHRADGSALWKAGSTHVLAAVHGPIGPRLQTKEKADVALVSVVIKFGGAKVIGLEREWETLITEVLSACIDFDNTIPRSVIEIVIQIIQDDGSVLSCALHAAIAALMDSGIPMLSLPVATTFLIPTAKKQKQEESETEEASSLSNSILLDPIAEEEDDQNTSILVLVSDNLRPDEILASHTIMGTNTQCSLSLSTILDCAQAASKTTPVVVAFWRLAIEQKVTRESQTLWSR